MVFINENRYRQGYSRACGKCAPNLFDASEVSYSDSDFLSQKLPTGWLPAPRKLDGGNQLDYVDTKTLITIIEKKTSSIIFSHIS